jgi:integrase
MIKHGRYSITSNDFLSETELNALNAAISSDNTRNALMLRLLLATGCRASELLAITKSHLNPETQSVYINGIKGSDDREIPLDKDLFDALQWYARFISSPKLFDIRLNRLEKIWYKMRPDGCTKKLHSTRHTFAIYLYRDTKDIMLVKTALGHRSLNNTLVYLNFVVTQNEMKRVMPSQRRTQIPA